MTRERFTYNVDFPGLRAPRLLIDRLVASFEVVDYTGATEDRALAMRELISAAVTKACRRLAAEHPELLQADIDIPRVEASLTLRLPTWFRGAPPESVVRLVSDALAGAASRAAGQALADKAASTVADLDPEEKLALKPYYEEAAAALRAGERAKGVSLLNQAEQKRAWHQAALQVAADLPKAARGLRAVSPVAALSATIPSRSADDLHKTQTRHVDGLHMTQTRHVDDLHMTQTRHVNDLHTTQTRHVDDLHKTQTRPVDDLHTTQPRHVDDLHTTQTRPVDDLHTTQTRSADAQVRPDDHLHTTQTSPEAEIKGDWLSDLAAEIEALMAAPGAPYQKAVLLAALVGPLPPELLPLPITARPPVGAALNPEQVQAARAALEAYLAGNTAADSITF